MESLTAKIYSQAHYKASEGAPLIFELTNHSKKPVHILKWFTPLEGMKSDCLQVVRNGKSIPYDGRLVKRGTPVPKDFLVLAPGASVHAKINISEAYNLSKSGRVKVDFKPEKFIFLKEKPIHPFLASTAEGRKSIKAVKVITKGAAFQVTGSASALLTAGEAARDMERRKVPSRKKKIQASPFMTVGPHPLPCKVRGGNTKRKPVATKAHLNGYHLAKATLGQMGNNKKYKTWFGRFSKTRFKKVKLDFQKITDEFEQKEFTYDLSGYQCDRGDYAYTYKGTTTIWLCSAFWTAPANGTDSRAGTLVHEHSHASAFTDDVAYGEEDCLQLSRKNPEKAVRNADSHEFYAGG
jgi:peptidyl-Lys metalloendopeptidase